MGLFRDLRRTNIIAQAMHLARKFGQEEKVSLNLRPGEETDLIWRKTLEHYDEIGWDNAPDYILKEALRRGVEKY